MINLTLARRKEGGGSTKTPSTSTYSSTCFIHNLQFTALETRYIFGKFLGANHSFLDLTLW
jgi:hypothetical protein